MPFTNPQVRPTPYPKGAAAPDSDAVSPRFQASVAVRLKRSTLVAQVTVKQLCCGDLFSLVLLSTGDLLSWGWNGANASLGKGGVRARVLRSNDAIGLRGRTFFLRDAIDCRVAQGVVPLEPSLLRGPLERE